MKRLLFVLMFVIPCFSYAQNVGVAFSNAPNWQTLLKQAKEAHKKIFIDLMATWCGPCKQMDKEVYGNADVGDYMNAHFISVKLQMDSTNHDSDLVVSWRKDAKAIGAKYAITALPSFLFFDENGVLIHKDLALKTVEQFLTLCQVATNFEDNYAGLKKGFIENKLSADQLLRLIDLCINFKEDSLSLAVGKAYKSRFIDNQVPKEVLRPTLVNLLNQFKPLFSFKDPLIIYMYQCQKEADKALNAGLGYARYYTDNIINRDNVNSKLWPNGKAIAGRPDWDKMESSISKTYNTKSAHMLILRAKVRWYREQKNWDEVVRYETKIIDQNGIDTSEIGLAMANNLIFGTIFKHGTQKPYLEKGITYMQVILKHSPENYSAMDTYANVLYKAGHKEKAIAQENFALNKAKEKNDIESIKIFEETIAKMNSGLPTWPL